MLTIQSPQMPGFATSYDLAVVALVLMLALQAFRKRRGVSLRQAGLPDKLPRTREVVTIGRVANLGQGPGPGLRFPAGGKEVHRRRRASICGYG